MSIWTRPKGGGGAGTAGKSAYQSWLDQGHVGTEAQFIASLAGAPGNPGAPGAPGAPGPQAGQEIASTDITTSPGIQTVNSTYVTLGQVVVPAGTPAHEVEVIGGILCQVATGTQPVGTAIRCDVAIFDESNTLVAYNAYHVMQDTAATTKNVQQAVQVKGSFPAAAVAKTYSVQMRGFNLALGASVNALIGGAFPGRKLVARYR